MPPSPPNPRELRMPDTALPGDRILLALKTRGPLSTADLGRVLGVTGEAARQQLVRLEAEGMVKGRREACGVGRPRQSWSLTAQAQARFPDTHPELTVQLIGSIERTLGTAALDRVIDARQQEQRKVYLEAFRGARTLRDRLQRLAAVRSAEGYMAAVRKAGDGYLLIENHCPICAAARACQGFCRSELELFQDVLGEGVEVERVEHVLAGGRRCAYSIREAAAAGRRK
jgi:predicted ArsR family transcriptional regulator